MPDLKGRRLKVKVTAPAENGKANEAVMRLLAEEWGISLSCFQLESGAGARLKTLRVHAKLDAVSRAYAE